MAAIDVRPEQVAGTPESNSINNAEFASYDEVLATVSKWTPAMRIYLAQSILETLVDELQSFQPKHGSLAEIRALLKSNVSPPDDAEVDRILEEARMERYGL